MPSLSAVATPLLALGALGVAAMAYFGTGAGADRGPEIADLRVRLEKAESERDDLRIKVGTTDRQMRGLSSDLAAMRSLVDKRTSTASLDPAEEAAADAETSARAALAPVEEWSPEQIEKLAEVLSTEKAQEALQKAARKERERADAERWERRASMMVDNFAERANLTEQQTKQMKGIVGKSMKQIRDVWSSMRTSGDLPAEERANLLADNRAKMEEIQDATSEEVKAVLSSGQFQMYEDDMARMRGGFGGRRGGDRGRGSR